MRNMRGVLACLLLAAVLCPGASAQQSAAFEEWADDFAGAALDETKWERYSFEGGGGGKLEVKDGQVRIRSAADTRAGIRSRNQFSADRFMVEARLAKVGPQLPQPGKRANDLGTAAVTVLFDGSGRNRVEWILP